MTKVGIGIFSSIFIAVFALSPANRLWAAETPPSPAAPDFQEVYDLIRAHLAGVSEPELNRTAVEALVAALNPKVTLAGKSDGGTEPASGPLIKTSNLLESAIAYLRIGRVDEGLAKSVREALDRLSTKKLNGIVLDLRFADGEAYAAAADTGDLFVSKERPLLSWGSGVVHSKQKTDAITTPVAVLVNGQTARAAEALAAVLRETGAGLILGSRTAGQAMVAQEYPLKNGQRLRIATASVQVGESSLLGPQGVKPDIAVEVNAQDEQAYYADAYKQLSGTNSPANSLADNETNRLRRLRFNEAELVRERRDGVNSEFDASPGRTNNEPEKLVRDPTLARALDVLKGLAVVRQARF